MTYVVNGQQYCYVITNGAAGLAEIESCDPNVIQNGLLYKAMVKFTVPCLTP